MPESSNVKIALTGGKLPAYGWNVIDPQFLNGAPLVVDPSRSVVQGPGAAAILFTADDLRDNPSLACAAVVYESPRLLGAPRPIPLFLLSCVQQAPDAEGPFTHVLSLTAMLPPGMDIALVHRALTKRAPLSAVAADGAPVIVADLELVSRRHAATVLLSVALALTTGRFEVPWGDAAEPVARVIVANVIDQATASFLRAEVAAGRPPFSVAPARVLVHPLPDQSGTPRGA